MSVGVTTPDLDDAVELRDLALRVGKLFGLDIYGLDVVETRDGPMVVDINDFPSFGQVPNAVALVSSEIVRIASRNIGGLTSLTSSAVINQVAVPLS